MTYATIIFPSGRRYRFTDEDRIWAARMIWGEIGGSGHPWETYAHLWASVYSMFWLGKPTLTSMMRAYAEPINPRHADPATALRPENIPRRIRIQTGQEDRLIPRHVWEEVDAFLSGRIPPVVDGRDMRALRHYGPCSLSNVQRLGAPALAGGTGEIGSEQNQCYWTVNRPIPVVAFVTDGEPEQPGIPATRRAAVGMVMSVLIVGAAVGTWLRGRR